MVKEKSCKSKHLQLISSVSPQMYWLANYVFDTVWFSLLVGVVMITLAAFSGQSAIVYFCTPTAAVSVYLLLTVYGRNELQAFDSKCH